MRGSLLLLASMAALLGACGGASTMPENASGEVNLRNLAATDTSRPRPAGFQVQGDLIPTPSDTQSRYYLLRERATLNGPIVAIIRQERGDRVAYSRSETDCARRLFHVVGTGTTRGQVETDIAYDGPLRSIDGLPLREELARFICDRSKRPLGAG